MQVHGACQLGREWQAGTGPCRPGEEARGPPRGDMVLASCLEAHSGCYEEAGGFRERKLEDVIDRRWTGEKEHLQGLLRAGQQ